MNRIEFTINGECVPKARPRFSKYGHVYTTPKTRAYEKIVKTTAIDNNVPCITTALKIKIMVYKSIPKSFSKEKRRLAESGKILPVVKPDVDNYVKAVQFKLVTMTINKDNEFMLQRYSLKILIC